MTSTCCNAPLKVEGRTTRYYVCSKCGKPIVTYVSNPSGTDGYSSMYELESLVKYFKPRIAK